jgi:hypothetical protein
MKKLAEVYHMSIYGTRESKFKQINEIDLEASHFTKLEPCAPFYLFVPQDNTLRAEYDKGWSLRDVFVESGVGITSAHDDFVVDFKKEKLVNKFTEFQKSEKSLDLHDKFNVNKKAGWDILKAWEELQVLSANDIDNLICKIDYRPFDARHIIYHDALVWRTVKKMTNHLLNKQNISLVFVRNQQGTSYYDNVFISKNIIDLHLLPIGSYLAPLYLYTDNLGIEEKTPNFKPEFLKMVKEKFSNPSPEQILGYIYAVLHSNNYRTRYLDFLKIDFPKIPFDVSIQEFKRLASLGQELIEAHLIQTPPSPSGLSGGGSSSLSCPTRGGGSTSSSSHAKGGDLSSLSSPTRGGDLSSLSSPVRGGWWGLNIGEPQFDGEQNFVVEKVSYNQPTQRLYFNKTCYFTGVSPAVWEFKIGGYQVLDKYLKSRKDANISGDLKHIQNIIKVLEYSVKKMSEVDGLI